MTDSLARLQTRLSTSRGGSWSLTRFTPLHQGRSLALLTDARPPHEVVVAKFYRDEADSTRAYRALTLVSERCLRASALSTLQVPQVLLHDESLAVLVQSEAPGLPLAGLASAHPAARMERVGRALAELHLLPADGVEPRELRHQIADLVHPAPENLAAALPKHAALIDRAIEWMHGMDRAWPMTGRPVLLHRDFQLRQLFDTGARVTVVDWDDLAAGDPSFDIYYMLAYLNSHLPAATADACARQFLDGYHQVAPAGTAGRSRLWLAFNHLRRAARRYRLQDQGWEATLDRTFAALSSLIDANPLGA